jgi:hypothetical protein
MRILADENIPRCVVDRVRMTPLPAVEEDEGK